jgi:anaerobic magnesium-protoporphyrin IX monomethyl ester cyclase
MNVMTQVPEPQLLEIDVPKMLALGNPPSDFLTDQRVFINLGILKVASSAIERGVVVEFLDCNGVRNYLQTTEAFAKKTKSRIFGFTATTPQLPQTVKMIRRVRRVRPDMKIVLGGPHVTLAHAAWKKEQKKGIVNGRAAVAMRQLLKIADVIVSGDGEDAIFAACHPNAPQVIDADILGGQFFLTDERLDQTRWPARHLVDVDTYRYTIDGAPALSLIAQLGCPYGCGFCGGRNTRMLRKIRTRSDENILAEMEHLWRVRGKPSLMGFMFYDDELNVNPEIVRLMRSIRALQDKLSKEAGYWVRFRLRGFIKSNRFTNEQAQAMYEAGFRWILIGFESGSEKILTNINKAATKAENTRCMEIAKRHGLKVKALMSIGHPGESPETIEETYQWLRDVATLMNTKEEKNFDFDLTVITCYLGTPYYDEAVRNEVLSKKLGMDIWTYRFKLPSGGMSEPLHQIALDYTEAVANYKGKPGRYKAYVFTDTLTPDDIVKKRDEIEASVRAEFDIPANQGLAAKRYEHSMGMGSDGTLPSYVLRSSAKIKALTA